MRALAGTILLVAASLGQASAGSTVSITYGNLTINFRDPALVPKPGIEQQYVADYRTAIASKDPLKYRALIHPASLKCLSDEAGQKLFKMMSGRALARDIPEDATIVIVPSTQDQSTALGMGALSYAPAQPERVIAIDYDFEGAAAAGKGKGSGQTIIDMLASDGDKYKLVLQCLTKKGSEDFLARLKAKAQ